MMQAVKFAALLVLFLLFVGCSLFDDTSEEITDTSEEIGWERFSIDEVTNIYAISFESQGAVLVTTNRGVYRSSNRGETWTEVFNPGGAVYTLAVSSSGVMYAGSDTLYRSADRGATWIPVLEEPDKLLVIGASGDIFTGSNGRLLHSVDEGKTWQEVTPQGMVLSSLVALQDGSLIASAFARAGDPDQGGGVFRSEDNGQHWVQAGFSGERVYNVFARSTESIFAVLTDGLYHTTDGGKTWSRVLETYRDLWVQTFIGGGLFTPPGELLVREVTVEGEIATKTRVLRSIGKNIEELEIADDFIISLAISPDGFLFAGTSGFHAVTSDVQGYVYRSEEALW